MTLWILIAVMTAVVALYILRPLASGSLGAARRGDYDLKVYQSQIDDLEAELARGVISEDEARGARNEIERRMLQAVRDAEPEVGTRGNSGVIAGIAVAIAVPVAAGLLYLELGRPDLPSQPLAERTDVPGGAAALTANRNNPANDPGQTQGLDSVETMVGNLEQRLAEEPENFEGWMLLGRSYSVMDRFGDAAAAYAKAAALPEAATDPSPFMQLGEALVFSSGGVVTERAIENFNKALTIDTAHPGAQYYLALARGQAGDLQGAYDGWVALAKASPSDAPWLPALMERINETAADLDIEVPEDLAQGSGEPTPALPDLPPLPQASAEGGNAPSAPGPTAEQMRDAQSMSAEDRQSMIRGMVEGLAERLAEEPDDYDGWMRLGRAYGVMGNTAGAVDAYQNAVRLRPQDPQTRLQYAIAVQEDSPEGPMTERAVQAFTELAQVDPNNPDALFMLGRADAEAGRTEAALERWTKLLAILQPGTPAHQGVAAQIEQLRARTQ